MKKLIVLMLFLMPMGLYARVSFRPGGVLGLAEGARLILPGVNQFPLVSGDITATMTSNTAPAPNVATSSGELSSSYGAWEVFDGNNATDWRSSQASPPAWLKYDFGEGRARTVIKLNYRGLSNPTYYIKDFRLQGSNDDTNFDTLLTATAVATASWQTWTFANTTPYRYYRFYVDTTATPYYSIIWEIELWEKL